MQRLYIIGLLALFSCSLKEKKEGDFLTTKSNFNYKIIPSSLRGEALQKGDIAKVHLCQFMDDSLMNNTYEGMPIYVKIDSTLREFDFTEILPLMKVNDSAICIFPVNEMLKRAVSETYPPLFLQKGKNIRVLFKVINKFKSDSLGENDYKNEKNRYDSLVIIKEKLGYEAATATFKKVLQTVNAPLTKLPNGVYVQLLQKGKGAKIKQGDSVVVVYKGMLADGIVFETTTKQQPFIFPVGEGYVVEGLDTGIASLSFGDKAKIFIPAKLAYGADKAADKIPAFANLIFEVEVSAKQK